MFTRFMVLAMAVGFLGATPAQAQSQAISPSLGVSPALVRQVVTPGKTTTIKLKLTNYGTDPIPLGVTKSNISGISEQGSPEFNSQITPRSAAEWVNPAATDLILPPSGDKEVEIRIKPPADLAPGGYNTALMFQAKLPSYYFDLDANARILPALSVSFLLSVPAEHPIGVKDLKISRLETPAVVLSSPIPVVSELNNPTNFFVYPDGELTIKPMFGQTKTVSKLDGTILMPDSTRKYINAYTGSVLPGFYNATLTLNQDGQVLVASARFVAVPWPFVVVIVLLFLGLVILGARRRLKLAYRALKGDQLSPRRPTLR